MLEMKNNTYFTEYKNAKQRPGEFRRVFWKQENIIGRDLFVWYSDRTFTLVTGFEFTILPAGLARNEITVHFSNGQLKVYNYNYYLSKGAPTKIYTNEIKAFLVATSQFEKSLQHFFLRALQKQATYGVRPENERFVYGGRTVSADEDKLEELESVDED